MFATFEDINEIEKFGIDVMRYVRGEVNEERFKKIRLNMGVYGQRQKHNNHMQRIKIPLGLLTSEQARAIASVTDKYSAGIIHITTRQDIQIHFVKIENTPVLMKELAEKGITTREACGNTIRNVTACCRSGICPAEKFDVTRDGIAVAKHNIRYELTQNLPRKFKISFSGCLGDCGLERIHDIGFIATSNGAENYYSIYIGGGLGPFPKMNHLLKENVESAEIFKYADEIIRYFDLEGNRKERNKARFKFVLEKFGNEKVVEDILRNIAAVDEFPAKETYCHPFLDAPPAGRPEVLTNGITETAWFKNSVFEQKQKGYYAFDVRPEIGDITPEQFRLIADLAEKYGNGTLRTTNRQTILVPWLSGGALAKFHEEISRGGRLVRAEEPHAIACPGRDTCNLGITSSRALARELNRTLKGRVDHTVKINISGCQNSCAQHHMGAIGFYGAAAKRGGRQVPYYFVLAGGRASEKGSDIGKVILKIPAKNITPVTLAMFDLYRKERLDDERPEDFFI
ncbi:MAG: nitrite/sulfite reductase, partial [Deltaproteobacteria bacterium]|nr:nitrite/sulfite reductase [Deltaproteobacteria bacterium]